MQVYDPMLAHPAGFWIFLGGSLDAKEERFARARRNRENEPWLELLGPLSHAGTSNRPGARFGPRSIREQSCYVGLYDQCWPNDYAFKDRFRLIDYGDVVSFPGRADDMVAAVEETVSKLVDAGVASLGLGGDHLTSYPALKAHARKHGPLSLIHFDAHPDLVEAPHLFHGSMFGVAVQEGLIDPERSIQIIGTPLPPSPRLHVLTADRCLRMDARQSRRRS
jgi:agmatinase